MTAHTHFQVVIRNHHKLRKILEVSAVCLWGTCLPFQSISHPFESPQLGPNDLVLPDEYSNHSQAFPCCTPFEPPSPFSKPPLPLYTQSISFLGSRRPAIPLGYLHLKGKCLPTGTFDSGVLNLGSITPGGSIAELQKVPETFRRS